jgi:hemerythrin superfamily protein
VLPREPKLNERRRETPMPTSQTKRTARATPSRKRRTRSQPVARQRDAIALLRTDHRQVDRLFKEYEKAKAAARKQALVDEICAELIAHTTVEEEIFYPAVRGALKDKALMDEADIEHASAKDLIAQLQSGEPGDDHFDAKVKVLGEHIRHHVKEEQTEMFPKAKKTKLDMTALGSQIETRKAELAANNASAGGTSDSKGSLLSLLSIR